MKIKVDINDIESHSEWISKDFPDVKMVILQQQDDWAEVVLIGKESELRQIFSELHDFDIIFDIAFYSRELKP